ncbi:MAG: lysophospholipid acyltransferase family protein [Pseudomonadota bacterium]
MSERKAGLNAVYWLQFAVFKAVIGALKCLPYARRLKYMGFLSRRVLGPLTGYRQRALANLAMIYPEKSDAERQGIADAVLNNFGRTLIETNSLKEFRARIADHTIEGPGVEAARQARSAGRAVIYASGHWGNYEAFRTALDLEGFKIGAVFKPMANPYFQAHYFESLSSVSGPMFPVGRKGTLDFARQLKKGAHVLVLFDVHVGSGPQIDFLGKPAHTSLGLAELALRFDALVIPFFATRLEGGERFRIELMAPILPGEPVGVMKDLTKLLEAKIAEEPGQWFWVHRRWKTKRRRKRAA